MATEPQTPTELLIERLENIDGCRAAFVVLRTEDGAINYRSAGVDSADLLGILRFVTLSVEHELTESWKVA